MTTYTIDNTHSEIGFTVRHMMFAKVRGQFKGWTGQLTYDAANPTKSVVSATIDTGSIDTREAQRDAHLRSGDFFDAEKFPKMTFQSKRITSPGKGRYELTGDLTIRDVTKEVTLAVEESGQGKDPWGNQRLGFAIRGQILRSEWGLTWNQALEAGGVLVSDKVDLEVEVQVIVKEDAPRAAAHA
jgi:polyisoprenoid-binding protein YceI